MAATPISTTTKYFSRGTTAIIFAESVSSISAITRSEINAGIDLSEEVQATEGWTINATDIPTPNIGSVFTGSIPGPTAAEESALIMYADIGGEDVRTLMPRGTNGYIIIMWGGDVTGRPADVFPVRVASLGKSATTEEEAATVRVRFSITSEPAEDVEIPA